MTEKVERLSDTLTRRDPKLEALVQRALASGVTAATIVLTADIVIDNRLSDMCRETRCEGYGMSMSCPPHVSGPNGFRKLLKKFCNALFFKVEVPSDLLFSSERREVFRLLHQLAAGIEEQAVNMGFSEARAYAGGSCKQIFCHEHPYCRALSEESRCRNPLHARPSMSGFGINVESLIETAGWTDHLITRDAEPDRTEMTPLYGLVLIS
ncbi:MAG: hypothetical protein DRH37_09250 [Deltaproteobacteria bacterium]|nr:MAG: hypothetical protein DRH37_09250 [Deltaproteobacteria bacterium]